jgi:hypothetical protein
MRLSSPIVLAGHSASSFANVMLVRWWRAAVPPLLSSIVALLAATLSPSPATASALNYNGGTYTQDFDGLPTNVSNAAQAISGSGPVDIYPTITGASSTLTGWQIANPIGNVEFKSQDGSLSGSGGRGPLSLGTNGSSERALGALSTSADIPTFGLVLLNNTSNTYTQFTLTYTGEHWRRGDIASDPHDTLTFFEGLGNDISATLTEQDSLNFNAATMTSGYASLTTNTAVNGNDSTHQASISGTISGLNWGPGQTLVLRWNAQDITGQDDGLGIDNLFFSASTAAVPEPASALLLCLGVGLLSASRKWLEFC